jgi:transcription elongation factor Elf1
VTSEHRVFIEATDIIGIEFECPRCNTRVHYTLEGSITRKVRVCPNCNEEFYQPSSPEEADLNRVMVGLVTGRALARLKAKIRLEINDPTAVRVKPTL